MASILSTDELERIIAAIASTKHFQNATSDQEMQKFVREGLGALLHLHKHYIEQCKAVNAASKNVTEQKTSYEKSLLALQNNRFVPFHHGYEFVPAITCTVPVRTQGGEALL